MKIRFSSHVVLDLRCIQRAEIWPECSILVLFGSWWGYLGVAMCFPMFPDQFRVIKVVRFEFLQKKSFLGLRTIVIWPYLGGAKGGIRYQLFWTFYPVSPSTRSKWWEKLRSREISNIWYILGHPNKTSFKNICYNVKRGAVFCTNFFALIAIFRIFE